MRSGLLVRINFTFKGTIDTLEPNNVETVCTDKPILGFWEITITVTAEGVNAEKVMKTAEGFVFFILVLGVK